METFPGVLTATEVADGFVAVFASEGIQISTVPELVQALSVPVLRALQCYWVDTQLRAYLRWLRAANGLSRGP